jgi:hypothetical protein
VTSSNRVWPAKRISHWVARPFASSEVFPRFKVFQIIVLKEPRRLSAVALTTRSQVALTLPLLRPFRHVFNNFQNASPNSRTIGSFASLQFRNQSECRVVRRAFASKFS